MTERTEYLDAFCSAADSTEGEKHPVRLASVNARSMFSSALTPEVRLGFALASDDDTRVSFALRFAQVEGDDIHWDAVALCTRTMIAPSTLTFEAFLRTIDMIQIGGHRRLVKNALIAVLVELRHELSLMVATPQSKWIDDLVLMAAKAKLCAAHWKDPEESLSVPQDYLLFTVKHLKRLFPAGGPTWNIELRDKVADTHKKKHDKRQGCTATK